MSDAEASARAADPPAGDRLAGSLRGFGPLGILAILAIVLVGNGPIVPFGAVLAILWARRTGTPLRALGLVAPGNWWGTALAGVALGIGLKLVLKSVVLPLLGVDPVNHPFHYLAGNAAALPLAVWTMIVSAGFGEEVVFRGFLFERFGRLFGTSAWASLATVAITAIVFGLAHWMTQGRAGAEQGAITGLVFGTLYVFTRGLPLLMIAHAVFDLTSVWIIYAGLETRVAHLVFR